MSASMTCAPQSPRHFAAVDFPDAIPPVSPMIKSSVHRLKAAPDFSGSGCRVRGARLQSSAHDTGYFHTTRRRSPGMPVAARRYLAGRGTGSWYCGYQRPVRWRLHLLHLPLLCATTRLCADHAAPSGRTRHARVCLGPGARQPFGVPGAAIGGTARARAGPRGRGAHTTKLSVAGV